MPQRLRPLWQNALPVGIIDFDNAAPGARVDDLGYATWKHLNLGLIELPPNEQRRRLRLMATAYGAPADTHVFQAIERAQERMRGLIEGAPKGVERDQALEQNRGERDWLRANRSELRG